MSARNKVWGTSHLMRSRLRRASRRGEKAVCEPSTCTICVSYLLLEERSLQALHLLLDSLVPRDGFLYLPYAYTYAV